MSIKTSIGTPTANSYVSVASANEYLEARENSDAWIRISNESATPTSATTWKENTLKQATRELDRSFRFHDSKYNQGIKGESTYQNLEFPRWSNQDANSDLFIPDEVKYATYEQALWIRERAGVKPSTEGTVIERQLIGIDAFNYIDQWVNRQVQGYNQPSWK
jgi:hypothetical protein